MSGQDSHPTLVRLSWLSTYLSLMLMMNKLERFSQDYTYQTKLGKLDM
jgi:hypothetical protein